MPRLTKCIVHRHEYVTAHEYHHLRPQSRGGTSRAENMVWLCANAHGDVHFFLDLIEKHRGPEHVPFEQAKHYGPAVRQVARNGWQEYAEAFLRGEYRKHAYLWSTSGQPREDVDIALGPTRLLAGDLPPFSVALRRLELPYWLNLVPESEVPRG